MTAEEQLDYVEEYFKTSKGKLKSLEDVYMAILWPVRSWVNPLIMSCSERMTLSILIATNITRCLILTEMAS